MSQLLAFEKTGTEKQYIVMYVSLFDCLSMIAFSYMLLVAVPASFTPQPLPSGALSWLAGSETDKDREYGKR